MDWGPLSVCSMDWRGIVRHRCRVGWSTYSSLLHGLGAHSLGAHNPGAPISGLSTNRLAGACSLGAYKLEASIPGVRVHTLGALDSLMHGLGAVWGLTILRPRVRVCPSWGPAVWRPTIMRHRFRICQSTYSWGQSAPWIGGLQSGGLMSGRVWGPQNITEDHIMQALFRENNND